MENVKEGENGQRRGREGALKKKIVKREERENMRRRGIKEGDREERRGRKWKEKERR
jgi:hypothetical protein